MHNQVGHTPVRGSGTHQFLKSLPIYFNFTLAPPMARVLLELIEKYEIF